ncbi:MAG: phosphate ABC transporter substrate-binding protein PstS [Pyrinomonadaceae bacterium]
MNRELRTVSLLTLLTIVSALIAAGCSGQRVGTSSDPANGDRAGSGGAVRLQGSGSTFVKPMMDKWTSEYGKAHPNVRADYQSTGSGAGIKAIQGQTVNFGATDAAMSDEEMKQSPAEIVHVPVILGAVVLTYNLEGVKEPLRLSPEVIADIFLGKIKKWDDPRLKSDNPNAALPSTDITPVYRSDGSGTSDVFTDFLSKSSEEWKQKVGRTKNPQLPQGVGIGAKGNEGVMGQVKQTPNTIGYVELTFAKANNLPAALVKNPAGEFVEPGPDTVSAAAAGVLGNAPADLRMQITNAQGANAYPISGMVYALIYKDQKDPNVGKTLVDFLWWATHDGQAFARDLHYAPLPPELVARVEEKLRSITSGGQALRP